MTSGLHHVCGITMNAQANIDFYTGFLGFRLAKKIVDADNRLTLFYGDGTASPGSMLVFRVVENAGRGRTGAGQVSEVGLAVPPNTIGEWLTRALTRNVAIEGIFHEFQESVLRLKDPDGLVVKLVGFDMVTPKPLAGAPARLRGVTILTDQAPATTAFVEWFGYKQGPRSGAIRRMFSHTDIVDVRDVAGYVTSVPGAGVPDHVAFRVPNSDSVYNLQRVLQAQAPTEIHDHRDFLSLHTRDPAGVLIHASTDGPVPPSHVILPSSQDVP